MNLNYANLLHPLDNRQETIENEALADKITLLAAQINAANYQFLKLVAEFDRRKGWCGEGVRSCAHWLNWKCGISDCAARERVRVARSLDELPMINKAFEAGEISYSKVRAMTRVATNENEDYLMNIARYGTASHVEKTVRKYQRVEESLAKEPFEDLHEKREFSSLQDEDGMWVSRSRKRVPAALCTY